MNFRTTYILFGVLMGLMGIFLLTQIFGKKAPDQHTYVLPSLHDITNPIKTDDIDRVEIERFRPTTETLAFYRDERGFWRLQKPNTRVESSLVNRIIDQLMRARKDENADLSGDLNRFGLDAPRVTATLHQKASDRQWTLNLGDQSAGGESALIYVTSSDLPKEPMGVRRSDLDTLFKSVNEFRTKVLAAENIFDAQAVKFKEPKKEEVALEKSKDNKWRFEKPAYGEADYDGEPSGTDPNKKITGVRDLVQAVADIRVESDDDFGTTDVADAELADKGVDAANPELLRIEVKRQPGFGAKEGSEPINDVLLVGKKADNKGEKLWARLASERNVVKVSAKKVEAVTKVLENPSVLRNRDLVQFDQPHVDAIDIKPTERDLVKLRKAGDPAAWKLYDAGQTRDVDEPSINGLLDALKTKRQIKDFPDPSKADTDLGLDKPTATISIWVDGIKKEEKKDEKKDDKAKDQKKDEKAGDEKKDEKKDAKPEEKKEPNAEPALKEEKPTIKLAFGMKDKDLVFVRREVGSETTRLAVSSTLLEKLSEGKLAYLDRKIPSFAFGADLNKIVLDRPGGIYELEKTKDEKSNTLWKLKQPKELAGRTAEVGKIDRLTSGLRDLQAEKLVAEKAGDSDLDSYGLKSPTLKATLTETKGDKKTEDHVYLFGKETEDKRGFYAKQGERDLVFIVRKDIVDALQADLRDPTVFSFDLGKVKGLKLVGWHNILGRTDTLDLERKSSQEWTVKTPADFKVDPARAESFLTSLNNLKAERFVGSKSTPKPEYKLDLKEGALEITVTVEGEKDPFTLTIGEASSGDGYFTTSNKSGDEVFLLPKDRFESAKSKPAYFGKEGPTKP